MRFAVYLLPLILAASPAAAQPGSTFALDAKTKARHTPMKITVQTRPGQAKPQTLPGLTVSVMASGLGSPSGIALAKDGTIYLTDPGKGRVIRLDDRGVDGQPDTKRVIASGLSQPSGIVMAGEDLYVIDNTAVWVFRPGAPTPALFVSLQNSGAMPGPRPMIVDTENERLVLGLNTPNGAARIIAVDLLTGKASLITEGPGSVTALAKPAKGPLWAGLDGALVPVLPGQALDKTAGQAMEAGAQVSAIIVPGQFDSFDGWPKILSDHMITAQSGDNRMTAQTSGGFNVAAVPTVFGQPQAKMRVLVDGFVFSGGRAIWGRPSAMAMDERGLMIADAQSGILWRVHKGAPMPVIIPAPKKSEPKPEPAKTAAKEQTTGLGSSIKSGSAITSGSQIKRGTTLDVGSHLVKEYEDAKKKKAEEEAAMKAAKDAPEQD